MKGRLLVVLLPFFAAACHLRALPVTNLPPLRDEAEVAVYLEALPQEAERLSFSLASFSAAAVDGSDVPLQLRFTDVSRAGAAGQRLLAAARIPEGKYEGFHVSVAKARLDTPGAPADLLVASQPALVAFPFAASAGKAIVVSVALLPEQSIRGGFEFSPAFVASSPALPPPLLTGYCSNTADASLTVFDSQRRSVAGVLPTGEGPRGLALDPLQNRAYVAISAGAVQVVDLTSSQVVDRIVLQPGDEPVELALAPSGQVLLVANQRSNTVSFVDLASRTELARVPTGDEPVSLLLDRSGQRAYVFNRRSNNFTVVDVANRRVVTTVATDPEPLYGAISRDGSRLYVICAGSAYVTVFSLPGLAATTRLFAGLGSSAILVDSRTDYIYVGRDNERRIYMYDPSSLIPVNYVDVPDAVSWLVIDDLTNTLLALMPERRAVATIDLTSRRLLAVVDVGNAPYAVRVAGQRP